jgi:LmbE family N-acetylglucosaminyl deacetylase
VYVCHVDDDILGAGGLIPQMVEAGHEVHLVYGNDGYLDSRDYDTTDDGRRAAEILGVQPENTHFLGFPTGKFQEFTPREFTSRFYDLDLEPDLIITHADLDVHPDHEVVRESAMTVGRSIDRQVGLMACEVLSSTEWNERAFEPNYYVDIDGFVDRKVSALQEMETEIREWPHPRSPNGIRVKAQQRGMEVGMEYAEAYRILRWFDWDISLTPVE